MADDTKYIEHYTPRSLSRPSEPESPAFGRPKNKRERQLDADHSLNQRHLKQLNHLHMEATHSIDHMGCITAYGYADAISRLEAITDSQPDPVLQQKVAAFNAKVIDPVLQEALGMTLRTSVRNVHSILTQRALPPPEEKKPSLWERFLEW